MDIQAMKISLVQKLLSVKDEATLSQIESVLNENVIVAYTVEGTPLTKKEYHKILDEAESEIEKGDFLSHNEVVKISDEWK